MSRIWCANLSLNIDFSQLMKIALTMGDPAGIGPEITQKALNQLRPWLIKQQVEITYFGDPRLVIWENVKAIECSKPPKPGVGEQAHAAPIIDAIQKAVAACVKGSHDAVVTNPINKSILYGHGFEFPGHTEFLGHLCQCGQPTVMMLTCDDLSVVPITLHVSLAQAIKDIQNNGSALIKHAIETTATALRQQGIQKPTLAISGLNPHAGEGGAMGQEEIEVIIPTIDGFKDRTDLSVIGPMPADTMFDVYNRKQYDAALAMTHDQALIPIKALAFDQAVNVTLGLPIIRTSPDHGTAYDIAGQGVARPASLIAAIKKAVQLAKAQHK